MNRIGQTWTIWMALLFVGHWALAARANHILPAITPGNIVVRLKPIAPGAAPLYGISPPGDTSRLFVWQRLVAGSR